MAPCSCTSCGSSCAGSCSSCSCGSCSVSLNPTRTRPAPFVSDDPEKEARSPEKEESEDEAKIPTTLINNRFTSRVPSSRDKTKPCTVGFGSFSRVEEGRRIFRPGPAGVREGTSPPPLSFFPILYFSPSVSLPGLAMMLLEKSRRRIW
ncbi:hypothetical protein LY76DRAFT_156829 [Colletotrichum caudatum]|nr:hypothetical protein LY76DRAFT_156829 [Colletotrichum caudatum]